MEVGIFMKGEPIDARESQGLIQGAQGDIAQRFGNEQSIATGGGDAAGGDLDKSTNTVVNVNNYFWLDEKIHRSNVAVTSQKLIEILAQVEHPELIRRAYEESLPPDPRLYRSYAGSLEEMVLLIQGFNKIPDFIYRLIAEKRLSQSVGNQLKDWVEQLDDSQRSHSSIVTASTQTLQSYLQIVLRPDQSSDAFVVSAWLIPDDTIQDVSKRFQPLDLDDERKGVLCAIDEISGVVDQYVRLSREKLVTKTPYELTIEVFLPLSHLCTDVEGWTFTDLMFNEQQMIGIEYRVVVRSHERLDPRYLNSRLNQWRINWERVETSLNTIPSQDDFEHLEQLQECNWKRVMNRLTQKLGLKLTCGLMESKQEELFTAILKAATPIAVWARCDSPDWNQVTEIDALLTTAPLLQLTEQVKQKRLQAYKEENHLEHLGAHLAILWEDPNRLTPDAMVQLMEPGQ
jgi:vWA-MoxR associated protein C-terminal domain/vWA-MoxR associated protein middle region (VMAP-M) 1